MLMANIIEIKTIAEYNALIGQETMNPLVSVIDFSKLNFKPPAESISLSFSFYAVFIKIGKQCDLRYGRNYYDYQAGSLVFVGPGQVVTTEVVEEDFLPSGHALLFHPDLIRGTTLGQQIKDYSFFSYDVHEALHVSEKEMQIVLENFNKIQYELQHSIDKHSKRLIVSNIELLLNYCIRFYDRQFITRSNVNSDVLSRFEKMLNEYFGSENPQSIGIPTVAYFAEQFHLSANYFGDLIKKETGKTAQEYIQWTIIEAAKEKIFDVNKPVGEIAYELGFKYPQHFTRFFKQHVGKSPNEYRNLN
jgi:AraC family transcriptional regulator, transcriptional activator of pobA